VKRASLLFLVAASAFAEVRTPWVASRIHGTPEPPKPFVAEQIYPQIPLSNALDMVPVPGSAQWLIAENGGKIWSVPDDPTAAKADLVADLKTSRPALDHVYGIAFHPNFVANQQVFITYTVGNKLPDGTRLSRFKVIGQTPLQIDPESGKLAAFSEPSFLRLGRGSLVITSALEEKANFTERFRELTGDEGDVYPFALPSLSNEGAYVPRSALLGVRVFVSIEESATAGALEKLGVEGASVAYEVRAVPLRGEVL
jgi:hypothetical protein